MPVLCAQRRQCPTNVIRSCKHGGLASMNGALGSGKLDVLEEHAFDDSHDGREPLSSGWKLKCSRRGASVAAVCLLLTLGSFAVPKSGRGLGSVMVSVSTVYVSETIVTRDMC